MRSHRLLMQATIFPHFGDDTTPHGRRKLSLPRELVMPRKWSLRMLPEAQLYEIAQRFDVVRGSRLECSQRFQH
jgi:hypothetical protein